MRGPHVAGVNQIEVHPFANDAGVLGLGCADQVRGQLQHGVLVELGGQPFLGQFDAVAHDAGEADFECIAFGPHGLDLDSLPRRLRRRDHRLGGEVEGNAQDVGVFHIEEALFVEIVGLAAESAADDLLAKELGAEGPDAQHMRDRSGIPALGEHGDGDDAADRSAQLAVLADRVHDLAEKSHVSRVLCPFEVDRRVSRRAR